MKILTKDGSALELQEGASALEAAEKISSGLAREATAATINGEEKDLRDPLKEGDVLEINTFRDEYGRWAFRHSSAHVLGQAIEHLYPGVQLAIGPAIDEGYYYDFDFGDRVITDEDLPEIEEEMKKIVKEDLKIERFTLPRQEAIDYFKKNGQSYKVELIEDLPEEATISFYKQGDFTDLCAGPHLMSTKPIKAFKLTSIAGAYWRGDEHRPMLTRIYGTSFPQKKLLEEHLERIEEAKKRDHRKIGKEMGIFAIMEEGPGFPFFLPKGMILKNTLIDYWRDLHRKAGYDEISTPIILSRKLWETSGHWDHYRENMYTTTIDEEDYAIKPMNCPGSVLVYKYQPHSYRELPLRYAELGNVHRHELSGTLHGLFRVRNFTQDDAHIFLAMDQIEDEVKRICNLIDIVYKKFGFEYRIELSTRPEDSMGTDEEWEQATNALKKALIDMGRDFSINEGDGAFYGPKIDFHLKDVLGRTWQCGTIQLDFQMPQRFGAEYTGTDGEKHRPVLIHRVVFGSVERFIGILIENYSGNFPIWLAPVQVELIPVNLEVHSDYAKKMKEELEEVGARVELDLREETLSKKIRDGQLSKTCFQIVVGDQEMKDHTVSVRRHGEADSKIIPFEEFKSWLKTQIDTRA